MKVFIVSVGWAYEGESVQKVFDTKEKAITHILNKYPFWDQEGGWVDKYKTQYVELEEFEVE